MRVAGIIAEYNPFHLGHQYHIAQTRKQGATHIVCVMSGNFVQRGEGAYFSKWVRAKAAVMGGADLVVELPTPFAVSSAKDFAEAGVFLLDRLGAQTLSFGSESGELSVLQEIARCLQSEEAAQAIRELSQKGLSYPKAVQQYVSHTLGVDYGTVAGSPNDQLAIEYLRAALRLGLSMKPICIQRKGAGHDSLLSDQSMVSASYLRSLCDQGDFAGMKPFMPPEVYRVHRQAIEQQELWQRQKWEQIVLYRLRSSDKEEWYALPDVPRDLADRLDHAKNTCTDLYELVERVASKQYTHARIRRALCAMTVQYRKGSYGALPQYARVLAGNEKGMELLGTRRGTDFPIVTKFAYLYRQGFSQALLEAKAADCYDLCLQKPKPCHREFTESVFWANSQEI